MINGLPSFQFASTISQFHINHFNNPCAMRPDSSSDCNAFASLLAYLAFLEIYGLILIIRKLVLQI